MSRGQGRPAFPCRYTDYSHPIISLIGGPVHLHIIPRKVARSLGMTRYFTGKPCCNGHIDERFVSKGTCVTCLRATNAAWRAENAEQIQKFQQDYRKANADRIKTYKCEYRARCREKIREYDRSRRRSQEYTEKRKEIMRSWRERNAEHRSEYMREWRRKNPGLNRAHHLAGKAKRRAAMAHNPDSPAKIAEWELSARKVCHWCGVKCLRSYHVDHYEPLARGGRHIVSNLVIACRRCNQRKSAKDPYQFAAEMGRLF